jgi:hypothetical protein
VRGNGSTADHEVRDALAQVRVALEADRDCAELALAKSDELLRRSDEGRSWEDILFSEEEPRLIEMLTDSLQAIMQASSRLRRAEAQALYRSGATMERIADLFGVTRQRVSHLLKGDPEGG